MIVGICGVYYIQHKEDFHIIGTVSVWAFLMLTLLNVFTFYFYGLQLKILTDHYSLNLNFSQWFGLLRISTFTNLWVPFAGGASVKAVYLKKFHNLPYASFLASVGIANVIKILINSLFAVLLISDIREKTNLILFGTANLIFIGTVIFLLFAHKVNTRYFSFLKYLKTIMEEWHKIRKDFKTIKKLIYVNCAIFFISSINIFFAFRAFSVEISLLTSGVISAFTMITGVLNLVPGNFGIREAIVIMISGTYGIGINEGLHAAALGRIISTLLTLMLMLFLPNSFLQKSGEETMNL